MKMPHKISQIWKLFTGYLESRKFLGVQLDNLFLKSLYLASLAIVIVLMLPAERPFEYSNLSVGSIAPKEIIAPFKFAILKNQQDLENQRQRASETVPPVFNRNADTPKAQQLKLKSFFDELEGFFKSDRIRRMTRGNRSQQTPEAIQASIDSFLTDLNKYNLKMNTDQLTLLYQRHEARKLRALERQIRKTLTNIYRRGLLDRSKPEIVKENKISESRISISENGIEEQIRLTELFGTREAQDNILETVTQNYPGESNVADVARFLVLAFLTPDLSFNETVTRERKEQAVHDVPLTRGYVEQDERIIDSNEKVTPEIYQKLLSLSVALNERSETQRGWEQFKFVFGKSLFALIVLMLTIFYVYWYRYSVFQDNRLLGMVTMILLLQFATASVIQNYTGWPQLTIPVVLAPMLLAMLLDFGIAFVATVSVSLILGSAFGSDYNFTLMALLVGSTAVFSVQKIRNRRQMLRAILLIMFAYGLVHFTFGLLRFEPIRDIFREYSYFLLPNSLLAPTVAFLLIGIFERIFGVTTDVTLLELSDLNHPLLKKLSVKAPGSFHHSIVVANLAEAGALAIKANALLTRVGCYFHDIGKMVKPEYFVENQMGGANKHENLSPHMSTLILINHVKEGAKMANKHNLPSIVREFITEHHGTSLIAFFYHKARETKGENEELNEADFRYPGPKPQSKETAIAMLADTVEAASRTLNNPTPQRIRNLVESLVEKKLEHRQLDDCDLTLKEINRIKEAFIPILTGIHHVRIEYPAEIEKEKKPSRDKLAGPQKATNGNQAAPRGADEKRPREKNEDPESSNPVLRDGDGNPQINQPKSSQKSTGKS